MLVDAFLEEQGDSGGSLLYVSIEDPEAGDRDWSCLVRLEPELKPTRIHGVDAGNAAENAKGFLRSMLAGRRVKSLDGSELMLS